MASILITGANGKIASAIIDKVEKNNKLFLFSRDKQKLINNYAYLNNASFYDYKEIHNFSEQIDIVLHCAFERSNDETKLLEAQKLSVAIFELAKKVNCKRFINISSQAVYDGISDLAPTEDAPLRPFDLYGTLKLSTEKILENILDKQSYLNIRLTALSGSCYPAHILSKIVNRAIEERIIVAGSKNLNFAFMDFRDAIDAFLILFDLNLEPKFNTYNLGNNQQYNILEIAQEVQDCLAERNIDVKIKIGNDDKILNAQLNSTRFMNEFNWKPKYSLKDTIHSLIDLKLGNL